MLAGVLANLTGIFLSALAANEQMLDIKQVLDTERLNEQPEEQPDTQESNEQEPSTQESNEQEPDTSEAERNETERTVRPYDPLRPPATCPTDVETLTALLIRDIPTYANRVLYRSTAVLPDYEDPDYEDPDYENPDYENPDYEDSDDEDKTEAEIGNLLIRAPYRPAFIIVAGRPELEPLNLNEYTLTTDSTAGGPLTQLFFTTLSRQYSMNRLNQSQSFNEIQSYHWLFLAEAEDGWWLAFMYSRIGDPDTPRAPTAPRESSSGSVGQAVQLWLRDCRAGAINPLEIEPDTETLGVETLGVEMLETKQLKTHPLN